MSFFFLFDEDDTPSPPSPPGSVYTTEDGLSNYTTEDALNDYYPSAASGVGGSPMGFGLIYIYS